MTTLKEKNDVLGEALSSINIITASFCRTADGASEEEKYDRGKTAFNEVVKVVANVMRRDLFGDEPPKKSWVASEVGRTLKMPVISMPGRAAIKYQVDDPELPRLAASIQTIKPVSGKVSCDCILYAGNEVLADMQVYRGKAFALAMVRRALKGAMSKIGKHRRMTANRQSREAANKEAV
jgi:hypothetical protein